MTTTNPITVSCLAKSPVTKWVKDHNDEPAQVTTVTLIFTEVSPRDMQRLASAALNEIKLDVEMRPTMEQASMFDD